MSIMIALLIASTVADVSFPAVEAVVTTHTHETGKRIGLVFIGPDEVTYTSGVPIHHLESGPLVWEISDGLYYRGGIGRLSSPSWDTAIVSVSARGVADLVGLARTNGGVDPDTAREHALRLRGGYRQYSRRVTPIADLIKENATELEEDWTLSMDIVCVDRTLTIALATYEGELYSWEARTDQNGEYEWVQTHRFRTRMFGQFRAYERNGDLIFIDERGAVYFGLGEEHRLVAQISGWPNQRHEGEEFILLQQGDGGPITPCIVNDTDAQPMEVDWQDDAMRYLFEADIPEQIRPLVRQCYDVLRDSE